MTVSYNVVIFYKKKYDKKNKHNQRNQASYLYLFKIMRKMSKN